MKFKVDEELCIGCGACEGSCPEVFELIDDVSKVKLNPVPEELLEGAGNQGKHPGLVTIVSRTPISFFEGPGDG